MRKTIIICLAALSQAVSANEAAENDTIIVNKPNKVVVIASDSLQSVYIEGCENNKNYKYSNTIELVDSNYVSTSSINKDTWEFSLSPFKKKSGEGSSNALTSSFGVGFCSAIDAPNGMDVRPFSSWELWWIICDTRVRPWHDNHVFSFGVGVDWRNFRMTDELRFVKNGKRIELDEYPEGAQPDFSRIKVFSVNFPIRYQYQARNYGFSVGPVLNLNTYSSIKTRYKLDGGKHKDVNKDARVTPVTVDFMATVNAKWLKMYVKYSPCNMLDTRYAPKFKSLTFGFML